MHLGSESRLIRFAISLIGKCEPGFVQPGRRFLRHVLILHDGTLTHFEVGDRVANPVGKSSRGDVNRRAASVRMFVLSERGDRVYRLEYKSVTRVELNFPGKLEPIHPNFGGWGYDELTAPEKGLFPSAGEIIRRPDLRCGVARRFDPKPGSLVPSPGAYRP